MPISSDVFCRVEACPCNNKRWNILKQHSQCHIYTTPLSIQHTSTDTYLRVQFETQWAF